MLTIITLTYEISQNSYIFDVIVNESAQIILYIETYPL